MRFLLFVLLVAVPVSAVDDSHTEIPKPGDLLPHAGIPPGEVCSILKLDDFLDKVMTRHVGAGGAVVVRYKGKTITKVHGKSEIGGSPVAPNTRFLMSSNGKAITALAVMLLKKQGRLRSLDTPIGEILDFSDNPAAKKVFGEITIRQLLNHTSGLPEYTDFKKYGYSPSGKMTDEKVFEGLKRIAHTPREERNERDPGRDRTSRFGTGRETERPNFFIYKPGTQFLYTNSNYALLKLVVDKLAPGGSYEGFLDAEVFKKLGMSDAKVANPEQAEAGRRQSNQSWATGYEFNRDTRRWDATSVSNNVVGDGGVWMSANDLGKYMPVWDFPTPSTPNPLGLTRNEIDEAFDPPKGVVAHDRATSKPTENATRYGFGWRVYGSDRDRQTHGGSTPGFHSIVSRTYQSGKADPTRPRISIGVLLNTDRNQNDAEKISELVESWFDCPGHTA